jgi:phage shock protein PspC (stress-responsive transcriptional regulator)
MNFQKRLYCSSQSHMVGGVCGGIADYLNIDPTFVRLALIAITLLSFKVGAGIYVILWVIMPAEPKEKAKRHNEELEAEVEIEEPAEIPAIPVPVYLSDTPLTTSRKA